MNIVHKTGLINRLFLKINFYPPQNFYFPALLKKIFVGFYHTFSPDNF